MVWPKVPIAFWVQNACVRAVKPSPVEKVDRPQFPAENCSEERSFRMGGFESIRKVVVSVFCVCIDTKAAEQFC